MAEIAAPIRVRMRGDVVAGLHAALARLGYEVEAGERDERRFGTSTGDAVRAFQEVHGLRVSGEVDEATARLLNARLRMGGDGDGEAREAMYRVAGHVVRADGAPVAGAEIVLSRQGITRITALGAGRTDAAGAFEIEYPRPAGAIDLRVELVADARREIAETRPQLVNGAGEDERVVFVVGDEALRGRSSFEQLEDAVGRALAGEGLELAAIAGLDQETLARLALATGKHPAALVRLRQAYAVAAETGIAPAIAFGLVHTGDLGASSASALLAQDGAARRATAAAALQANAIPARLAKDVAAALDRLDELARTRALESETTDGVTPVGALLEAAGLSVAKRRELARAYVEHGGAPQVLWKHVRDTGLLTGAEIDRVQIELQLAVVTQNHAPLNRALTARGVARLADLAKLDRTDWLELAGATGLPAHLAAAGTTEEVYADLAFRTVEDALPTAMVAHRVERFPDGDRIAAFLARNPAYDLRTVTLRAYLERNPDALAFAADPGEARATQRAMQQLERVYRVAAPGARVATMEVLLRHGLDSAHKIHALGRAAFVRRHASELGGEAAAVRVFGRASHATTLAATLAARYSPAFNATPFYALPRPRLPVFADLFGSEDHCACSDCQSVYSPAAYLVDTLHWLAQRPAAPGASTSLLDRLLDGRRADLAGLELSCANTHTPLPHLDLVNEILELLVAPPAAPVSYQTTASAAALRARPEHQHAEAYRVLAGAAAPAQDAVYPFHLPFDLGLEESRAYLGQLGISRDRLMEALLGADAARTDLGVAIEMLGMSTLEWDLIAGQARPPRTLARLWGLGDTDNTDDAVAALTHVARLLAQAAPPLGEHGMELAELTDLLRTDFVQQPGRVEVVFAGSSCDTERAVLDGLTEAHLERMHRFIRLRRRLGWSAAELDRAIHVLGGGALDAACLTSIAHAQRLARDASRPVSEVLSWWGPEADPASLARALGLDGPALATAAALTGIDPFGAARPGDTVAFRDEVRFIRGSGFTLDELAYLLRDRDTSPATFAPDPADTGRVLWEIGEALRQARADTRLAPTNDRGELAVVIERLASAVGLELSVAAPLLREPAAPGSDDSLLQVLGAPIVADYTRTEAGSDEPILPSRAELPAQFEAFERLHKAARLLARLRIDKHEIAWVLRDGPARGTLHPLAPPGTASYGAWRRLCEAVQLRDRLSPRRLFDLFAYAATPESALEPLVAELCRRSGWDATDVELLASRLGFTSPADWQDERPFTRIAAVIAVARRVGLPVETIWGWRELAQPSDDDLAAAIEHHAHQAAEIEQAARGRYGEDRWNELAPPLRDRLRERQRDALAGWLAGGDPAALSDHLLLDVQMSACQLTSRVRQAIGAVQLFVQRVQLGLEPDVALSRADADEWTWRRSYRVWEANRKVFLYPENWLEPELRDDKTPLFVELEQALLQDEVTDATAEAALRRYLERLDDVARLEIIGLHHEHREGADVLHVLGRTRNAPATYYYRRRTTDRSWTPWEVVEAGIEGSHVLPVVFARRLYVFWPIVTEAARKPPQPSAAPDPPDKHYQVRLAWTSYRDGTWAPRQVSEDLIDARSAADFQRLELDARSSAEDFFLVGAERDGDLVLDVVRQQRGPLALMKQPSMDDWEAEPEPDDDPDDGSAPGVLVVDDSLVLPTSYVTVGRFRLNGCGGGVSLEPSHVRHVVRVPRWMRVRGQRFRASRDHTTLALPVYDPRVARPSSVELLRTRWRPLEVVPARMSDFLAAEPFVVQDARRAFLVTPRTRAHWVRGTTWWGEDDAVLDVSAAQPFPTSARPEHVPDDRSPPSLGASSITLAPRSVGLMRLFDGAGAFEASLGSRVVAVAGRAPRRPGGATYVTAEVTVIDATGREITRARTGATPPAAAGGTLVEVRRTLVMPPLAAQPPAAAPSLVGSRPITTFTLEPLYHPYACLLRERLERAGIDGVFDHAVQQARDDAFFASDYAPTSAVARPLPREAFDFGFAGPYASYNWELFFHIPFLVACQLGRNQRFEEAQRWFHRIFDPTETEGDAPRRFWKVKPLAELFDGDGDETGPIAELLLLLQYDGDDPGKLRARDELVDAVAAMHANPFSPHALARVRLATYARAVVMKYVDNLIAWGDQLFRRDTLESIGEAAQLYVLAARLLGRRPRRVERDPQRPTTFAALREAGLDAWSNALLEDLEALLPELAEDAHDAPSRGDDLVGGTPWFCVPPNDKLLTEYWGRVADRLFKLRHCMNLDGAVRELPLFEPPLDPALLVRARAAGLDLASALADVKAELPHYRYQVLAPKALELCADVRALGQALLAALEKKDAEELSLLRAGQQVELEAALVEARRRHVDEAREQLAALHASKAGAELRRDYYRSRPYLNAAETVQFKLATGAGILDAVAVAALAYGTTVAAQPDATFGTSGFGLHETLTYGGTPAHHSADALSGKLRTAAGLLDRGAAIAGFIGGYQRRADDWSFQADLAERDIQAIDRQLVAAEIRVAIAERELASLELQLAQSRETEAVLRDKYTNVQLYQWMVGQLSSLHFQAYQLAYDLARRAERAWQHELALDTTFIQFGYWDSLKKGLLAGERLHHDLRRMDAAYLDANRRDYELVRHVSLRELDPAALLHLRREGSCTVTIPEEWFDLATPGHYRRRIKTVSLSIPSVTGPYASVPCTLTLQRHELRVSTDPDVKPDVIELTRGPAIVTSGAHEDSGLFETSLRDERFLPFEGAGAISTWRLELPTRYRQFDYATISDVVLHVRYTAHDGRTTLLDPAEDRVARWLAGGAGACLVSARTDFPDAWASFLAPPDARPDQVLALALDERLLPAYLRGAPVGVTQLEAFLLVDDVAGYRDGAALRLELVAPDASARALELASAAGELPHGMAAFGEATKPLGRWTLALREHANLGAAPGIVADVNGRRRLNAGAIRDLVVVLRYRVA